jgi:hypothetical protein
LTVRQNDANLGWVDRGSEAGSKQADAEYEEVTKEVEPDLIEVSE